MKLIVSFKPVDAESTEVEGAIDVDIIPMMLRPMIGSTLQKAADQFGTLFANLARHAPTLVPPRLSSTPAGLHSLPHT